MLTDRARADHGEIQTDNVFLLDDGELEFVSQPDPSLFRAAAGNAAKEDPAPESEIWKLGSLLLSMCLRLSPGSEETRALDDFKQLLARIKNLEETITSSWGQLFI